LIIPLLSPLQLTFVICGRAKTIDDGGELIITLVPDETHPREFLAVTEYVPPGSSVNIPLVLVYVEPFVLYVMPTPRGADMLIVPVEPEQDGCIIELTVGAGGDKG
jgi:hypothetical protein